MSHARIDNQESRQGHCTQRMNGHSHNNMGREIWGIEHSRGSGHPELWDREFSAIVEGMHTSQLSTSSSLITENSIASLRRQRNNE